jgi:chorismate mutase
MSTTALNETPEDAVTGDGVDGARRSGPPGTEPTGRGTDRPMPDPVDAPHDAPTIAEMRVEIDAIDAELLRLIQRRTQLSRTIGAMRASEGGTRIVYSREMKILERFADLGPAGTDLGMLLLSMGRGKLGRR